MQKGQAAAIVAATANSLSFRIRAPSPRPPGCRQEGKGAAPSSAQATWWRWRSGAPCTKRPAKGRAQKGQAAALAAATATSLRLPGRMQWGHAAALVAATANRLIFRIQAPSPKLLRRRQEGRAAAATPAQATCWRWRRVAPCTRRPATGRAQEGLAALTTRAPGTSIGRRIRDPSPKLPRRRQEGPATTATPAHATCWRWRRGALCNRRPAKGRAQKGQAAALAAATATSLRLPGRMRRGQAAALVTATANSLILRTRGPKPQAAWAWAERERAAATPAQATC